MRVHEVGRSAKDLGAGNLGAHPGQWGMQSPVALPVVPWL
jgi:hypothetical protein